MGHNVSACLIAGLGSEPQVITATIDLLFHQGVDLHHVCVVHTAPLPGSAIARSLDALRADAESHIYPKPVQFTFEQLYLNDRPLADVETPEESAAAFQMFYRLIHKAKQAGEQVHLCIAGGRKTMAIYGMVAAQLLFDERDKLWHLYSAGDFLTSRRLHPLPEDQVSLREVPVLLRSYISPALAELSRFEDADRALAHFQHLNLERRLAQCRAFVQKVLTPAEQRAVALLVSEGLSDQEIAARLHLSPRTVEQQLRSAYSKAAAHWELEDVNRAQLVALLGIYYTMSGAETPQK